MLLLHHDKLQIAQMAKLLEIVNTSSVADSTLTALQEGCHVLGLHDDSEPPDDDSPGQVNALSTRHGSRQQNAKTQARHLSSTAAAAPTSNRGSSSGKRKLKVMPKELAAQSPMILTPDIPDIPGYLGSGARLPDMLNRDPDTIGGPLSARAG